MPKKQPAPSKGLLPKLKGFLDDLADRYHQVLRVIDEALASESLKDKIWAVDIILKRTPSTDSIPASAPAAEAVPDPAELDKLSDAELTDRIRHLLKDPEA